MAGKKRRGVEDVRRYTRSPSGPQSFHEELDDDTIISSASFFFVSLVVFLAIVFSSIYFGTQSIEENLEARSHAALAAAGFDAVAVDARGATLYLSGSLVNDQRERDAFAAVASLVGVRGVEGKLWPVFSGVLEEVAIVGGAIEIEWKGDTATVRGNVASEDRRDFVRDALIVTFSTLDMTGLSVLEGLTEEPGWLGATLGLIIRIHPLLPEGRAIVSPDGKLLVVTGEVEDKALRNELNEEITKTADELGFAVNPAIRALEVGPTQEEIEDLQVSLNELIDGRVVEFASRSFELTVRGTELLDDILEALRSAPEVRAKIAGHTDSRGSAAANVILSEQRANAVLSYLIANGESADRFDVVGYGESRPIDSNDTAEGRARNRRIEFTALEG